MKTHASPGPKRGAMGKRAVLRSEKQGYQELNKNGAVPPKPLSELGKEEGTAGNGNFVRKGMRAGIFPKESLRKARASLSFPR